MQIDAREFSREEHCRCARLTVTKRWPSSCRRPRCAAPGALAEVVSTIYGWVNPFPLVGGEAQRLKLAAIWRKMRCALASKSAQNGKGSLFLFDEPTPASISRCGQAAALLAA